MKTELTFSLQLFAEAAPAGEASEAGTDTSAATEPAGATSESETAATEEQPAAFADRSEEPAGTPQKQQGNAPAPEPAEAAEDTARLLRAVQSQLRARRNRARAAEVLQGWEREAEELKKTYPAFSLKTALREGGDFAQLLKAGVSLRRAYETAHLEEILGTAMRYAARRAGQRAADLLRDLQTRPQENPVQQRAATQQGTDVNSLTQNDILRILGEVSRGAKITFK